MLPIGTVLSVKGNENLLMVVGLIVLNEKTNMIYEYAACIYPIGVIGESEYILFNSENIEEIFHKGLESENHKNFVKISKAVNHYGEYENIDYEIDTYDKFLEIQKNIKKSNEVMSVNKNIVEYTEL